MLCGVMADDFGCELAEDAFDALIADVEMDERGVLRYVLTPAAAVRPKAVEYDDVVPRRSVCVGDVRSDESGSAGDDDSQEGSFAARRSSGRPG